MKNIEEKLNNLPKAKLPLIADLKIRSRIYFLKARNYKQQLNLLNLFNARMIAITVSVVLFVIITLVPVYTYASPGVTQGNALYPLKRLVEQVELALPGSVENKAVIYEKNASRRLAEAEVLSLKTGSKSADYLTATVNEGLKDKSKAAKILSNVSKDNNDSRSFEKISKSQKEQKSLIIKVAQNVGIKADDEVVNTVSRAISVLTDEVIIKNEPKKTDENVNLEEIPVINNTANELKNKSDDIVDKNKITASSSRGLLIPSSDKKSTISRDIKSSIEIKQEKKNVDDFVRTIKNNDFSNEEADNLRTKLETKIEKANQSLIKGDFDKAGELIDESRSLMKNAKFFLKLKPSKSDNKTTDQNGLNKPTETLENHTKNK